MPFAEITFKSGATILFDCENIETNQTGFPGVPGHKSLRWTTPEEWSRKLIDIDLDEVVAIVFVNPPPIEFDRIGKAAQKLRDEIQEVIDNG